MQSFVPGGVELTARLTALNNSRTQHVKIERKGRDNRSRQEPQSKSRGRKETGNKADHSDQTQVGVYTHRYTVKENLKKSLRKQD